MSCRSTKGRYLKNKTRCVITLITEYLTWLVKTKAEGKGKTIKNLAGGRFLLGSEPFRTKDSGDSPDSQAEG